MKNPNNTKKVKKVVKAWAIVCPDCRDGICHHENTVNIYWTKKEANRDMIEEADGMPKCTYDTIIPCTITYTI